MDSLEVKISNAIKDNGFNVSGKINLSRPNEEFGDYSTNIALQLAKESDKSPHQIAESIVKILKTKKGIESASVAGPGFINIKVSDEWLDGELQLPHLPEKILKDQKFIIEYSSPNIAKPMHVGHLRTTILGQSLVNLYRMVGADVCAWSHPGDWGVQFGKLIVGWQKWGDEAALKKSPIEELLRVYVKFHAEAKEHPELDEEGKAMFRALLEGDAEAVKLWKEFTVYSQKEFDKTYDRLKVSFDIWRGESEYNNKLQKLVDDALQKQVAKVSDGAVVILLDDDNLPPYLIRKSDGATLYATAEMVSVEERANHFCPEEIICVVGNEQTLHMQQSFAAAKKLANAGVYGKDFQLPKLTHVSYGFFRLTTGKMSTRQGELIRLDDVLDQAVNSAKKLLIEKNKDINQLNIDKLAEEMGVGAVKYTDLVHDRHTDVVFDWERMFALDGNSIVYMFYTNARCNSLLAKTSEPIDESDFNESWSANERKVVLCALEIDNVIEKCVANYDPHFLLEHSYELASAFSRFYNSDKIIKVNARVRERRLKIVRLVQDQLKIMFDVLGITPPEKL
jgi:arginyl-tRNA synthetase